MSVYTRQAVYRVYRASVSVRVQLFPQNKTYLQLPNANNTEALNLQFLHIDDGKPATKASSIHMHSSWSVSARSKSTRTRERECKH